MPDFVKQLCCWTLHCCLCLPWLHWRHHLQRLISCPTNWNCWETNRTEYVWEWFNFNSTFLQQLSEQFAFGFLVRYVGWSKTQVRLCSRPGLHQLFPTYISHKIGCASRIGDIPLMNRCTIWTRHLIIWWTLMFFGWVGRCVCKKGSLLIKDRLTTVTFPLLLHTCGVLRRGRQPKDVNLFNTYIRNQSSKGSEQYLHYVG